MTEAIWRQMQEENHSTAVALSVRTSENSTQIKHFTYTGGKRTRGFTDGETEEEDDQVEEYEKLRNARLAENRKRMAELGILRLSASLTQVIKSHSSNPVRNPQSVKPSRPIGPSRRSLRLEGGPRRSYSEFKKLSPHDAGRGGWQTEIYTHLDEKLLGSYEKRWELLTDGFDEEGYRIVDHDKDHTCHQCRQRGIGRHTWCNFCEDPQGQICGDCLFKRYGENVLEALASKYWTCPCCRELCNCGSCRIKRGWNPTGNIYKQVIKLGYKSVAHFLVLTRQSLPEEKPVVVLRKDDAKPRVKDVPTVFKCLSPRETTESKKQASGIPSRPSPQLMAIGDEMETPETKVAVTPRRPATRILKQETEITPQAVRNSITGSMEQVVQVPVQVDGRRTSRSLMEQTKAAEEPQYLVPKPSVCRRPKIRRLKDEIASNPRRQQTKLPSGRRPTTRSTKEIENRVDSGDSEDCVMLDADPEMYDDTSSRELTIVQRLTRRIFDPESGEPEVCSRKKV